MVTPQVFICHLLVFLIMLGFIVKLCQVLEKLTECCSELPLIVLIKLLSNCLHAPIMELFESAILQRKFIRLFWAPFFLIFPGISLALIEALLAALQRHYAVLQALALDEDEMPEIKDETLPDQEGMARC